jgi:hypothetical protein
MERSSTLILHLVGFIIRKEVSPACPSLICFPLCWQSNYFKDMGFTNGAVHEDNRLQTTTSPTAQATYI